MLLALWFFIKQRMKKEVEVPEVKYEKTAEVMITEDGFIPETITIKKNTQITFTNTDEAVHTVSSDPYPANDALEGFDSKEAVPPEGSYSFVFTETGEWTYHDDTKPLEFKGTVIVEE
jgi:plastocyanin